MSSFPKVCGCSRAYTASEWSDLRLVGRMDDGVDHLELRDCVCGSTIAVLVADIDREHDAKLTFEVRRAERIERLYAFAWKALDLATAFLTDDQLAGVTTSQRVIDCARQVREYRRAIARLRRMRFAGVDIVLAVALAEDFAA